MFSNIAAPSAQPIHWIRTLLLVAEAKKSGVSEAASLAGTRIQADKLNQLDVTITLTDEIRIMVNVAQALPEQPIGLRWGQTLDVFTYHSVGMWASGHETLSGFVESMVRYQALLNAVVTGCIRRVGEEFWLEMLYPSFAEPNSSLVRLNNESMLTSFLTVFRQLSPLVIKPISVEFCHAEPAYQQEYKAIFECPMTFNTDTTRLVFKASDMDVLLSSHHPVMKRLHTKLFEHEYERFVAEHSLADLIRIQLRSMPEQSPTTAPIADSLGISERTLRRRLEQEGTCFRDLHKEVFMQNARHLLLQGCTVEIAAQRLGYADASSFRRALKRLCGLSPSQLRSNE